jgi:hypothetical protein
MIILQKASKRARSKIVYRPGEEHRFLRRPRPGHRKNRRKQNRDPTIDGIQALFGRSKFYFDDTNEK